MTELMFSILFFIIVSAICVQAFAGSYGKSREATELTQAVNLATNTAEQYLTQDDFEGFTDYYDKAWNTADDETGVYKVTAIVIEPETDNGCQSMHVVVSTIEDEEIYSLKVEKAIKE